MTCYIGDNDLEQITLYFGQFPGPVEGKLVHSDHLNTSIITLGFVRGTSKGETFFFDYEGFS